ncbi:hypothetical protein VCSRO43_2974 [Vibrio cholerae]|nr:Uncharacterised protein [Vibrio cholerae]BCI75007.1 hypothetical protein VCSRO102_0151 [Vibrio cholerae]BCK12687.1 hypothetical protein VCSRO45_0181 [Vibrio cholerae]GHX27913.1 hypothetical protein VCSRO157_2955 [Vibrio cholerae]GHX70920.1 hypothetical protein VCSRO11_3277 [Vibrio cholerae]
MSSYESKKLDLASESLLELLYKIVITHKITKQENLPPTKPRQQINTKQIKPNQNKIKKRKIHQTKNAKQKQKTNKNNNKTIEKLKTTN